MIRITPIGTCRIHTPLSRAVARYPIELDLRRNYGFVHTSDEALQQLRFLQGEKQFEPDVFPLVFRPGDAEESSRQIWDPSDLHFVEISSAKRVLCGNDAVQINYLYRHFGDFFGSNERSRQFWNLVRGGHRRELIDFLGQQTAFLMMSAADRELLMSLSTEQQTFKTIKSDMAEIVERLGREHVLFVTHVNAVTPDGEVIPSRDRLIRWVKLAADQLNVGAFDPTEAMIEFGQVQALENRGLDLTHYTPAFSDRIYDVLHQEHVAALFGSQAAGSELDDQSRELASRAARIESRIGGSDFLAGSRELHAALEGFPGSIPLLHLRGIVRSRIGDFRGAMADLTAGDFESSLSQPMRMALLEALDATGNYDDALRVADGLIRDEVENAGIYRTSAHAAERLGRRELAVAYAKQAYRMDRGDLSTALHALMLLSSAENDPEIEEWRREILENIGASSSGSFELCVWAVSHRDEDLFAAGLKFVARVDKWSTIDLMEEALAARMPKAIAASVPVALELGRLAPGLNDRRSGIIRGAVDQAQALARTERAAEAHQIARALASLPASVEGQVSISRLAGEGRRLIRELVIEVREAIVQAHSAGELQAVVDLGMRAGDILLEDGKSAVLVARALQSLGDAEAGLDLLKRVSADASGSIIVRRWTARLAHAVRDYATALEMYGSLRDERGSEVEKLQAEIDRFFGIAEPRSLKELSLVARAGNYDEALRLAGSITRYIGPHERTDRELARMHKMLRIRLKQIQEGDGDLQEREPVLRRMVQMKPDDDSTLRRLALELMRQFRFAEAAECWERLCAMDPGNESASRNRLRCATLAERRSSASAQVLDIA
jgi:tetratricopeptide (TPR) repeat protein